MITIFNELDQVDARSNFVRQYSDTSLTYSIDLGVGLNRADFILAEYAICDWPMEELFANWRAFHFGERASSARLNFSRDFMLGMLQEGCLAFIESAVCKSTVVNTEPDTEDTSYAA